MKLLLCIISILLDLLFSNIIKYNTFSIPIFFPMFTISTIVFISNYYKYKDRKNYYYFILLISIIYDVFFINNLLITCFLFELLAIINIKIRKFYSNNLLLNIISLMISIFIYDTLFHVLLVVVKYQNFNINRLIFKYTHSILLNVIYILFMFIVLKPQKA